MTGASASPWSYVDLRPGDAAPWFRQRSPSMAEFAFDSAAGRYVVLCFFASSAHPKGREALQAIKAARHRFDDVRLSFFGVTADPTDEVERRVQDSSPGIRFFWDTDCSVGRLYGAAPRETERGSQGPFRLLWLVLDPTLRVVSTFPIDQVKALFAFLDALPPPELFAGFQIAAPILVLPNVFESDLCSELVSLYDGDGGEVSGFMLNVNGKTVPTHDPNFKVRRDYTIEDRKLLELLHRRIRTRVIPEIKKVHQFAVTRMERHIVACYAAEEGGHFRPHRDNTTPGTAHRRFAVSINLNDEFEGGEISFPEYGPRRYKAPKGYAVVFSCSLMHGVSRVTAGRRYAFLPFLYDDAAAKVRQANSSTSSMAASPMSAGTASAELA
jgi:peroxiredoxin